MVSKWIGKVAVVTGASSGIGASIFKELAQQNIIAIGLARRFERIEAAIADLKLENAYARQCDVSDPNSVTETFKWIEEKFGTVNIIVNNAGIGTNVDIIKEGNEVFEKLNQVIDTNIRGVTQCTREAYRLMKKADDYGLIIQMTSVMARSVPAFGFSMNIGIPCDHAINALSEVVRQELIYDKNKKVRITNLSPGYVKTNFHVACGLFAKDDKEGVDKFLKKHPYLKPEDIANAINFILSSPYDVNISELTIRPVGEMY